MCATLGKETFVKARKRAMEERKESNLQNSNSVINTAPEVVAALKSSSMMAGKTPTSP